MCKNKIPICWHVFKMFLPLLQFSIMAKNILLLYCNLLYFHLFIFSHIVFLNQLSYKISQDTYNFSASSASLYSAAVRNLSKLVIATIVSGGNSWVLVVHTFKVDLCEFKASLVYWLFPGQTGLHKTPCLEQWKKER